MNTLSSVFAVIFTIAIMALAEHLLGSTLQSSFVELGWPGMAFFVALAFVAATLGRVLALATYVATRRPATAMTWLRPRQAASLGDWASSSWDFEDGAGRHQGHCVCGLVLSIEGSHMPKGAIHIVADSKDC